jgi:hypothetical protein
MTTTENLPEVVSREEWIAARKELLVRVGDPAGHRHVIEWADHHARQIGTPQGRARHQNDARPGTSEGDDCPEIVGRMLQPGLESGVLAGQHHHGGARGPGVRTDPRLVRQVGHAHFPRNTAESRGMGITPRSRKSFARFRWSSKHRQNPAS